MKEDLCYTYIRTISSSPNLAKQLKVINLKNILSQRQGARTEDEHGLLNALLEYCPNILRIEGHKVNPQFWLALSHAATLGQLP